MSELNKISDVTFKMFEPKRENLVPALQEIQNVEGFISQQAITDLSEYFSISKSQIYSIASFYTQFKFIKPGKHTIKVCRGTACHVKGSGNLLIGLEQRLGIVEGQTTPDGNISLERVACLGACALAPAIVIDDIVYGNLTLAQLEKLLGSLK